MVYLEPLVFDDIYSRMTLLVLKKDDMIIKFTINDVCVFNGY